MVIADMIPRTAKDTPQKKVPNSRSRPPVPSGIPELKHPTPDSWNGLEVLQKISV